MLEFISRQMGDRGVTVVGVSAWGETHEEVQAFKKKKGLTSPIAKSIHMSGMIHDKNV